MRLAASLFRASARQSRGRLTMLTGAVAFGVLILFLFSAYHHAIFDTTHTAWRTAYDEARHARVEGNTSVSTPSGEGDPLWMESILSPVFKLGDKSINTVLVATDGGSPEKPEGLPAWPEPGQYWVSPAVAQFLTDHPQYDAGSRFGTTQLGVLPEQMLASPDEHLVIVGAERAAIPHALPITDFHRDGQIASNIISAVIYLGIVIVLFPVVILISIAAKLGSVQREQRYAALRLVGATNKQILSIVTFESLVAAVVGYALGALAYLATRPLLFDISFGHRQWPSRISLTPWHWVIVALATLALIFFSNAWGMRGLRVSPLGVARQQKHDATPRIWRLLPLLAGVAIFTYIYISTTENKGTAQTIYLILAGVIMTMIGLIVAGPWITYALGALARKAAQSADIFIGSSYVRAHAGRVSRSVVGVVLALFAGSFFLTAVSDVDLDRFKQSNTELATGAVNVQAPAEDLARLAEFTWVKNITNFPQLAGVYRVLPCGSARDYLPNVRCDGGVVGFNPYTDKKDAYLIGADLREIARLLEDRGAYIEYDPAGDPVAENVAFIQLREAADVDHLRTALKDQALNPDLSIRDGRGGRGMNTQIYTLTMMTYMGIGVTLIVSVISLVVSTYAGLLERRRSLLSLRLSGMKVSQLGKMVLVESFVPLVAMATVATAAGIGAGFVLMHAVSYSLNARLNGLYVAVLIGALIAAGFAIAAILPSMKKMTQLSVNRTE
ncbi:MAG: ABC transporter permease [Trueperella pyogenes]|nr:ABC transporter permease [Trueperella pyogenes]MCI7690500.1 ABC transporter permease [Trueperella pyogenes]